MQLFAEPPRTAYDLHFDLLGFRVRIHPLFWVIGILLGRPFESPPAELFMWLAVVLVSILVHELGHALAFRRFGLDAHIVLWTLGGLAIPQTGWGESMGLGGSRLTSRQQIIVSLAGPFAGFALAGLIIGIVTLTGHQFPFLNGWYGMGEQLPYYNLSVLIFHALYVNIFWGLINLLPIYPLDGGQVARELLTQNNSHEGLRQTFRLSMLAAGAMAVVGLLLMQSLFVALLFGMLAFGSYQSLQQLEGGGW